MRIGVSIALVLALGTASLAGCGGGSGSAPVEASTAPMLRILVTDAPFPSTYVDEATVVIHEVRARQVGVEDEDARWVVLYEGEREIDLVPLTGGVSELLVAIEVPPGAYDEVRLLVDAGTVVLSDDAHVRTETRTFTVENGGLDFPSGSQTGIKVKIDEPVVVTTGLSADLTLDFDLARNFVFNGAPGHAPGVRRVLFTPVVRAVNETTKGTIALVVLSDGGTEATDDDLPAPDVTVHVYDADGVEVATPTPADDGTLAISLFPGTYSLLLEATGHESVALDDILVELGNVADEGTVRLALSLGEITGVVESDAGVLNDDTDDVPLAGATVSLRPAGDAAATPLVATSNASGVYRFESLLPGTYDLTFAADGHVEASVTAIEVDSGDPTIVDRTLAPSAP